MEEEKKKKKKIFLKITGWAAAISVAAYGVMRFCKEHDARVAAEARAEESEKQLQNLIKTFEKRSSQMTYYAGKRSANNNN